MRILALTNLYPNPQQPHRAAYNRQHFREFAAAGHQVRVIVPVPWTDELNAWRAGKPALPRNRCGVIDGIQVEYPRYYFTPRILRRHYGAFFLRSAKQSFNRTVHEFRPDVIFSSWAYPDGWAAIKLGHGAGIPVVVNVVGSDVLLCDAARRERVAETARRASGIVAASENLAARVVELGADGSRVRAVQNGVDKALFHPGARQDARRRLALPSDAHICLLVGNLVHVKGLDVLISAIGRMKHDRQNLQVYLIGQGQLRSDLERQAASLGVLSRICFVGGVAHDRLPDWFRAADVFVLPSRSEGVPNVLLEAIACGTRFVATRVGGVPEVAHFGEGQLVEPGQPSALAAAIREALTNPPSLRGSNVEHVRTHAQAAREITDFLQLIVCLHQQPREVRALQAASPQVVEMACMQP